MDLIGPIQNSICGNKYILTIMDDHSRFGWTIFMKSKSETFYHFHNWFNEIKNPFNKRIQYIRTDNSTDLITKILINSILPLEYNINSLFLTIHNKIVGLNNSTVL